LSLFSDLLIVVNSVSFVLTQREVA